MPWPAARLKVLPLAPIARTWTERILVVGDAAGLVKPTTGGGIYYGLLTGHLGASVLGDVLRDDGFGGRRLKEYERRWRALLGPDIRAGLAFRAMAARLTDGAVDRLVELASVEGAGRLAAGPETDCRLQLASVGCQRPCATPNSAASCSAPSGGSAAGAW